MDIFEENETRYQLRNDYDFKIARFQIVRYARYFLRYQVPHLRSKLSPADKYSDNLNLFVRNIRGRELTNVLRTVVKIVIHLQFDFKFHRI